MGLAAFFVCGTTAFYTHRATHGRTADERAAYEAGAKAAAQAPRDAKLPTDAELNMMAQKYLEQQASREQFRSSAHAAELQAWKQAFENGYTDGFKKTHPP